MARDDSKFPPASNTEGRIGRRDVGLYLPRRPSVMRAPRSGMAADPCPEELLITLLLAATRRLRLALGRPSGDSDAC
jgi:hypothetical protein